MGLFLACLLLFGSYQIKWYSVHRCRRNPFSVGCTFDFIEFYALSFISFTNLILIMINVCWKRSYAMSLGLCLIAIIINTVHLTTYAQQSDIDPFHRTEVISAKIAQVATYIFLCFGFSALLSFNLYKQEMTEQEELIEKEEMQRKAAIPPLHYIEDKVTRSRDEEFKSGFRNGRERDYSFREKELAIREKQLSLRESRFHKQQESENQEQEESYHNPREYQPESEEYDSEAASSHRKIVYTKEQIKDKLRIIKAKQQESRLE